MPLFEVHAVVNGKQVSHVAEYVNKETAQSASEKYLGPKDVIVGVSELNGYYGDTRRIAAAMIGQTADDGFVLL